MLLIKPFIKPRKGVRIVPLIVMTLIRDPVFQKASDFT